MYFVCFFSFLPSFDAFFSLHTILFAGYFLKARGSAALLLASVSVRMFWKGLKFTHCQNPKGRRYTAKSMHFQLPDTLLYREFCCAVLSAMVRYQTSQYTAAMLLRNGDPTAQTSGWMGVWVIHCFPFFLCFFFLLAFPSMCYTHSPWKVKQQKLTRNRHLHFII